MGTHSTLQLAVTTWGLSDRTREHPVAAFRTAPLTVVSSRRSRELRTRILSFEGAFEMPRRPHRTSARGCDRETLAPIAKHWLRSPAAGSNEFRERAGSRSRRVSPAKGSNRRRTVPAAYLPSVLPVGRSGGSEIRIDLGPARGSFESAILLSPKILSTHRVFRCTRDRLCWSELTASAARRNPPADATAVRTVPHASMARLHGTGRVSAPSEWFEPEALSERLLAPAESGV